METAKYADAINAFNSAIAMDPKNPFLWDRRGCAYTSLGNHMQAISDFTKAISLSPMNGFYYCERGLAYCGLRDLSAMKSDIMIAARLGNPEAQELVNEWTNHS
jgi:Flp pilus assembly protein TadD